MLTGPWNLGLSSWYSLRHHGQKAFTAHSQNKWSPLLKTRHVSQSESLLSRGDLRSYHRPSSESTWPRPATSDRHRNDFLSTIDVPCWWPDASRHWKIHTKETYPGRSLTTLNQKPNNYQYRYVSCSLDSWLASSWNCRHIQMRLQCVALCLIARTWCPSVFRATTRFHQLNLSTPLPTRDTLFCACGGGSSCSNHFDTKERQQMTMTLEIWDAEDHNLDDIKWWSKQ